MSDEYDFKDGPFLFNDGEFRSPENIEEMP